MKSIKNIFGQKLDFQKIATDLTDLKSEFKCAKNTCQTMLVMNKKYV